MTVVEVRRDTWFLGGLALAWFSAVFLFHGGYPYLAGALPSLPIGQQPDAMLRQGVSLTTSIDELKKKLLIEKDPVEKAHAVHNIGLTFYDLYTLSRRISDLDSARRYLERSAAALPDVARFHYNLGRTYTEMRRHDLALVQYEGALALDPRHVLALHNLGLLTYFERTDGDRAREYLLRALTIDAGLPICNYVLGEIALDKKDFPEAMRRFRTELSLAAAGYGRRQDMPASRESIEYALQMTHLEIAGLFSAVYPDRDSAQAHINAYLGSETDPVRRKEAMDKIRKFWVVRDK